MSKRNVSTSGRGRFFGLGAILFFVIVSLSAPFVSAAERLSFNSGWKFQKGDAPEAIWRVSPRNLLPYLAKTGDELLPQKPKRRAPGGTTPDGLEWAQDSFDDAKWTSLDLPHDWAIAGPFSGEHDPTESFLPCSGTGWYRKSFSLSERDKGKKIFLDFDGVMSFAAVWINGKFAGGWPYGYTSFRIDATPFLRYDRPNTVAVRVANPAQTSRWYTGGGIYRNVWLVKSEPVHFDRWGTFIRTPDVSAQKATLAVSTQVRNETKQEQSVTVQWTVRRLTDEGPSDVVACGGPITLAVPAEGEAPLDFPPVEIENPALWSPESPSLYLLETALADPAAETREPNADNKTGQPLDTESIRFGVRNVEFTADRGLILNGQAVKLRGCCLHHDLGPLGAAINVRAMERQLRLLQEAGCNAIRLSHNPAAPEMMDLLDRLGFLVQAESFDQWTRSGGFWRSAGYCDLFEDWHEKDLRTLVRRDRNHPSVIMWSIGNEIPELQSDTPRFIEIAKRLCAIVREEDPTRPTTSACNDQNAGFNGVEKVFDLFGYNYFGRNAYEKFHKANPNLPAYGSETTCLISTRGFYAFPVEKRWVAGDADFSHSSYGWQACNWNSDNPLLGWAAPPDIEFATQAKFPWVCGEFVWTGFDYLGAPFHVGEMERGGRLLDPELIKKAEADRSQFGIARCPLRVCETGLYDTAGFKKDIFWLYRSVWLSSEPTAHLLPHWTWPGREGEITPVYLFTSGDEAELFLNGQSLGRKKKGPEEYRLIWDDVRYTPGELSAVAYKDGKEWACDSVKTAGPPTRIRLTADREKIAADGADLAFVTAEILDSDGNPVPTAKTEIRFDVSDGGRIVATDNGDGRDWTAYTSPNRKAFGGLALGIAAFANDESGESAERFTVTAAAEGLESASIEISRE